MCIHPSLVTVGTLHSQGRSERALGIEMWELGWLGRMTDYRDKGRRGPLWTGTL